MDRGSLTDAFCIIYQLKGETKTKIGQTECIADNLSPVFIKTVELNYFFEQNDKYVVEVYDADDVNELNNLKK